MAFITIDGQNLIAYKNGHSEVLNVTHFVLANIAGLGAEPVSRIEAMPIAGDIVHTQAVTQHGYVNANQVVYSLAMDSTIGDFDFNWVGLKAAGGELVACAYITTQHKTANAGAVPGNNLTRNFLVAFSGIAATTAIAVPAETWQIDFTTRLLQIDDRERLSNFDIYGQASFFDTGFKVSLQSGSTYAIAAGVGYVGGIRCEQAALSTINATGLPKSIWMDASLQGDINGVSAVFSFSATAATLADYTDGFGFKHYLTKLADISAGGVVTDLRVLTPHYLTKPEADGYYKPINAVDVPTGVVLPWTSAAPAPAGFVKPVGLLLSRTAYANLWAFAQASGNLVSDAVWLAANGPIGSFSTGDGAMTFRTPLIRDFMRFIGDGGGIDAGRVLGSFQLDELKWHAHAIWDRDTPGLQHDGSTEPDLGVKSSMTTLSGYTGGTETRPRNTSMSAILKI